MTLEEFCASAADNLRGHINSLAAGQPVTLVGYCSHANVGDNAISRGEDALLASVGARVRRIADDRLLGRIDGPVLLHGGGNIGDLYRSHQDQRVEVIESDPGRPILQLPQSIHFEDHRNAAPFQRAVAGHRDFTLLVRDERSLDWARSHLDCETYLAPDCAFALGPLPRASSPSMKVFVLARTDDEARPSQPFDPVSVDWLIEPRTRAAPSLLPRWARYRWRTSGKLDDLLLRRLARARLRRGLALLASGERVATDRLHAVILCALMGVPVVAADNSYGKVSGYVRTWNLDEVAPIAIASDLSHAVEQARRACDSDGSKAYR